MDGFILSKSKQFSESISEDMIGYLKWTLAGVLSKSLQFWRCIVRLLNCISVSSSSCCSNSFIQSFRQHWSRHTHTHKKKKPTKETTFLNMKGMHVISCSYMLENKSVLVHSGCLLICMCVHVCEHELT